MDKVTLSVAILLFLCAVVVVESLVKSGEESKRFFTRLDESSRQFRFALCALTTSQSLINWKWLHQLYKYDIAVYVLEDKDENQLRTKSYITYLSIETEMARNSGFSNGNLVHRVVQAWDKALFYFTKVSRNYEFVWFIEYDVYIPSLKAFLDVHNIAMHDRSDLVVRENVEVDSSWIPWRLGDDFHMDRPWYHSLVCAAGLSRRLLSDVLEYTRTNHQLEMIEVLFHTITHHKKYNLYLPRQFETINFNPQGFVNWDCKDVLTTHSDMWYHPIKNQTKFLSDCYRTHNPSVAPSVIPSSSPSEVSSTVPTAGPSTAPTLVPSFNPSEIPSAAPSVIPSSPSEVPSTVPTAGPSLAPTLVPSVKSSELPSIAPTVIPSSSPSEIPSTVPTAGLQQVAQIASQQVKVHSSLNETEG